MALKKQIELDNGIILNYHRVVSIKKVTNIQNQYEIASYISKEQREKEEEYQILQKRSIEIANQREDVLELETLSLEEQEKLNKRNKCYSGNKLYNKRL